MSMVKIK